MFDFRTSIYLLIRITVVQSLTIFEQFDKLKLKLIEARFILHIWRRQNGFQEIDQTIVITRV